MQKRIFKRKIYDKILAWKNESDGQSALLIEGARRVGKSTVVEEFARKEYESYIIVDFNKASRETKALFEDLTNLDFLFLALQATYGKSLVRRKSVIVFDEVQQCPLARQAIKYLVEDGRYDYIETGSLISIKKNTRDITIPSEEDRMQMYPMDYEEFRWALGDDATFPLLKQFWDAKHELGAAHRKAMRDMRLYMLVGGMPQAVNTYLETNNLQKVDAMKRKIIKLYEDDFRKIDPSGKIGRLFMSIPGQISRNTTRYLPSAALGPGQARDKDKMEELLQALEDSKTVNFVYHCTDPNVGMELTRDDSRYKLFIGDTGLFITLAFWDKDFTENVIYQKLLSDKLSANIGYVYENFIAQILVASGNRLFYYTWPKDEKHYYEIDFLLSRGSKVCPIEVKSSGYNAHTSLDEFCKKFRERVKDCFLLYTKDFRLEDKITMVPVYLTSFI